MASPGHPERRDVCLIRKCEWWGPCQRQAARRIPFTGSYAVHREARKRSKGLPRRTTGSNHSNTLAPLLWIDEPFVVRRAAAKVFEQRGCGEDCISETLTALHAIWRGQPALEVQATALVPSSTPNDQEYLVYLRKQTEEDYFVLLGSNPCLTGKTLQTKYGSDSEFFDKIRKKVGPC